jgi:DNA-binding Xre family transcriptional regulator
MADTITLNIAQINFIKLKMEDKGWINKNLITNADLGNQAVSHLLTGKSVDMKTLSKACKALGIDEQEILQLVGLELDYIPISLDLISKSKEKLKPFIKKKCGDIRILDYSRPVEIGDIYISIKITETISRNHQYERVNSSPDISDTRCNLQSDSETILVQQGIKEYSKLMIFGKPGAGKTTVLKSIANRSEVLNARAHTSYKWVHHSCERVLL